MVLRLFPKMPKSGIHYLLIVLAFALLVLGVLLFFKFRMKVMENEKMVQGGLQAQQPKPIIPKSAYHDCRITQQKNGEEG